MAGMGRKSKRVILYTICFFCIMLIDWSRGSQKWHYWATCINLTGVVMSVVMLSHFSLKQIPLKKTVIWLLVWLLGSVGGYLIWKINPGTVFLSQFLAASVSVGCLGVVALTLWQERKNLNPAGLGNLFLVSLWVVLSVLMLLSGLSELWPVWYLVMFGMFYLTPFTEEEKTDLWEGLANGIILGFFILQIFAYGFRPYDEIRYKGAYGNCNINAMMYLAAFIMALYKYHGICRQKVEEENKKCEGTVRKKGLGANFYYVLAAGVFSFLLFTMTRTALLVALGILFVYGILDAVVFNKTKWWRVLTKGVIFCICVMLTLPCVYLSIRYLPTILNHPIWWEGEYTVEKVHSFDPFDSEKYVSWDEAMETMLWRFYAGLQLEDGLTGAIQAGNTGQEQIDGIGSDAQNEEVGGNSEKYPSTEEEAPLLTGADSANSINIRVEIYKKYFKNLNLTGHALTDGYFQITESYHAWHAQNVFLQIAFYHGIPAGICFMLLAIGLTVGALRLAVKGRKKEDILPLLIILFFLGYGMLECVWYLGQSVLFLIYTIPKILIDGRAKENV